MSKTHTKGNVVVEDVKIGDRHYEYGWGGSVCTESTVQTLPEKMMRAIGCGNLKW